MIKKAKPAAGASLEPTTIELPALNIQSAVISLIGDTPLICHNWSHKAKQEMRDKQTKKAKQAREAKDPNADSEASLYKLPQEQQNGSIYGFPAIGLKSCAVDACSHVANITKTLARGAFHIDIELVPIKGAPRIREDMVRLSGIGSNADIRYRGEFPDWSATFQVRYNANVISLPQLLNLFNTAGFAVGIGDWRPQKDGRYGMFHVATTADGGKI